MTGSASVSAAMRNNFCISNLLLVKLQRLLRQAEADVNITDVVQGRGDVAAAILNRHRGAQRSNRAGSAQIFGLAPLLFAPLRLSSGVVGHGPISESLYLTEAYDHAGRDPNIVVDIVAARGAVAEFRQHVIGLDQPERELAAESFQVNPAAGREREARIGEVTGDSVVLQSLACESEQGVSERLNLPARSQRVLRAE